MRKTSLAAGAAALALVLAGCGGGEESADGGNGGNGNGGDSGSVGQLFQDAGALAEAASQNTSDQKTAKFDMTVSMGQEQMTYEGEGEFGDEQRVKMTMDMGGQQIETIMIGQTMYMQAGPQGQYMKADMSEMAGQQGGAQAAEMNDPTRLLEFVQQAGEITGSERANLEGEPTTHYTVDLDFQKMAEEMGAMAGPAAQQLQGVDANIPMELWLNGDELPVKITMDMSELMKQAMEQSGAGGNNPMAANGMTMEMNYRDWGAPVNVEEPPADQVQEAPAPGQGEGQGQAPAPVPGN
ncbi:hypothetical protein BJF85_16880 [Saccharomonospora sp. CUA-673]|uniref:hypothetical protein n=1 Tax=Saccharomonospora sp. CUA-673 TaxID=1904969 RepID=UPI000966D6F8|nr:hypothetical protein [Saccharomonospora sp. CUA-673]OLT46529.1 hypothetical protein BJF85_16880 [Saccharomonospora sp. CUA-673]